MAPNFPALLVDKKGATSCTLEITDQYSLYSTDIKERVRIVIEDQAICRRCPWVMRITHMNVQGKKLVFYMPILSTEKA